ARGDDERNRPIVVGTVGGELVDDLGLRIGEEREDVAEGAARLGAQTQLVLSARLVAQLDDGETLEQLVALVGVTDLRPRGLGDVDRVAGAREALAERRRERDEPLEAVALGLGGCGALHVTVTAAAG